MPYDPTRCRTLSFQINGRAIERTVAVHMTLAEFIRDTLSLKGTKIACDQAACGSCTVLLDGHAVFACHTLAAHAADSAVETIEGLSSDGTLHPLQVAFVAHDALQCGFCTPGMIMALKAVIDAGAQGDRAALAHAISGNLCRCGAYEHILDAALSVVSR